MSAVWVNGKFLDTSQPKAEAWTPAAKSEKVLWGICVCGEPICEGDSVGMRADHELVVCYACWLAGTIPDLHLDCAGLRFLGTTLSQ